MSGGGREGGGCCDQVPCLGGGREGGRGMLRPGPMSMSGGRGREGGVVTMSHVHV